MVLLPGRALRLNTRLLRQGRIARLSRAICACKMFLVCSIRSEARIYM